MQKEDEETNTIHLYASEKERYDAQIRSLQTQVEAKGEELAKLETLRDKGKDSASALGAEVEELLKLSEELNETLKTIEGTIAARQLEEDTVSKINVQVEKVEKLRNRKISVFRPLTLSAGRSSSRKRRGLRKSSPRSIKNWRR